MVSIIFGHTWYQYVAWFVRKNVIPDGLFSDIYTRREDKALGEIVTQAVRFELPQKSPKAATGAKSIGQR